MPAAQIDPDKIHEAVTQAYNLSCRLHSATADEHTQRINQLAAATVAVMSKWKAVANLHPIALERSWKAGGLTDQQALYRSLGSFAMYSALMALEAFASISGKLSEDERKRLSDCMENYALACMAVSLCRTCRSIRLSDEDSMRKVRLGINLPTLGKKEKFDKAWIAEARQFTRVLLENNGPLPPGIAAGDLNYNIALHALRLADQERARNHDLDPVRALLFALRVLEPVAESSIRILLAIHAASWARISSV